MWGFFENGDGRGKNYKVGDTIRFFDPNDTSNPAYLDATVTALNGVGLSLYDGGFVNSSNQSAYIFNGDVNYINNGDFSSISDLSLIHI